MPKNKKYFFVRGDIGEGYPYFEFIVTASNLEMAEKKAGAIIKDGYPENWEYNQNDFSVNEVKTFKDIIRYMEI